MFFALGIQNEWRTDPHHQEEFKPGKKEFWLMKKKINKLNDNTYNELVDWEKEKPKDKILHIHTINRTEK